MDAPHLSESDRPSSKWFYAREMTLENGPEYWALFVLPLWAVSVTQLLAGLDEPLVPLLKFVAASGIAAIAFVVLQRPSHIRTSARGVEVKGVFGSFFYTWSEIDRFTVSNPREPVNAYILLAWDARAASKKRRPRAVPLPQVSGLSPSEIVEFLNLTKGAFETRGASLATC